MSPKYSDTKIHRFIKGFVESKEGALVDQSDETFTINLPNEASIKEYTYQPALAREKKIPLITTGSPAFQEILKECLKDGVLCQVSVKPKGKMDSLIKKYFKDSPFICEDCDKLTVGNETVGVCIRFPRCHHQINNAKIVSTTVIKKERTRYFRFYFSAVFQNKLRPKNEEKVMVLLDEEGRVVGAGDFREDNILGNKLLEVEDASGDLEAAVFDKLKTVAEERLEALLKEKLVFFDLTLAKEIKSKLRSFDKRLKGERREKAISRKHDFDERTWQANYDALLKREEESFIIHISVKFLNLLIINTTKFSIEIKLDNNSSLRSSFVLGINIPTEVTCPECGKTFFEGYATQDAQYLCRDCVKQSVDTGKIYFSKQDLTLDAALNEYIEPESGFVCAVCGQKHSRLLEFKCSHDQSSVCIYHYGLCDLCGNVFSERNLLESKESKRKLCPAHAAKCGQCGETIGVDEGRVCKGSGKRLCSSCMSFAKCSSCHQEYSSKTLTDDRCPACSNLTASFDEALILAVQNFDSSQNKTSKWLVGKNALNSVIVAKGVFSSTLYVVENGKVTYQKSFSLLDKLRGR